MLERARFDARPAALERSRAAAEGGEEDVAEVGGRGDVGAGEEAAGDLPPPVDEEVLVRSMAAVIASILALTMLPLLPELENALVALAGVDGVVPPLKLSLDVVGAS